MASSGEEVCSGESGRVFAAGLNDFGQLGIGSSVTHSLPTFAQEAKAGWTYIRIAIFTPVKFLLCANHFPVQLQVRTGTY
uniref:Uncharacterized protein n=1 Tax=Oryza rufipogon TaxID=4529 RepID=A0A0E0QPP1_ORYRU